MYKFKVDLNGDAVEDLTYRITFDERDTHGKQRFILRLSGARKPRIRMRQARRSRRAQWRATHDASRCRIWAGQAGDPFWIEPDVLHAVGHAFQDGTIIDLSGWDPAKAKNLFAGHTVYSIVLEVPDSELLAGPATAAASGCGLFNARHRCWRMAFDQPMRPSHDPSAFHPIQ